MAALLTTKNEQKQKKINKSENSIIDIIDHSNETFSFNIFDLAVLILSVFSIISDLCTDVLVFVFLFFIKVIKPGFTYELFNKRLFFENFFTFFIPDLILVIQYSNQGYKSWAAGTFILIFFPSVVVQFFSLRWYVIDKTATSVHWVLHFFMIGIIHRYIQIIKAAFTAYRSKSCSDIQKVYLDQSDLCMLHLFESFLESAPQLVLQMYVIAMLHEWKFWTGLSALASLLSLAWALAAYTKTQRKARPNKNISSWPGLLLQAIWRTGMLTSRISTLVLGAYCFGNYVFIIITIHWIAMYIWIVYQKTDFCETWWEEKIYNAVVGVIYCFCFFNLQEGQSRWRALAFYLVIVFENLTCLTVFLMWFSDKTPKLAISGFIAIVGGTVVGAASMLVYYRFFHPSGPIEFFFGTEENKNQDPLPPYSSMTLKSLKRTRSDASQKNILRVNPKEPLNDPVPSSDSIVVLEENVLDDTDAEIKILQDWIDEGSGNTEAKPAGGKAAGNEGEKVGDAYKRRAICSLVDLAKMMGSKTESDTGSLKLVGTDEASSEILSAHDYENLAAVNIAREEWGLRSWRGYSDIETWLHDDSVVHDRRLDTLTSTTSSDRSANTLQKENERTRQDDYIDAIAEDLAQCESETGSDDILGECSVESLPVHSLGGLDPIFEEIEESSTCTDFSDSKTRNGSASTLVATIDEIRRNTPIQNRYRSAEAIYDAFSAVKKPTHSNWKKVTFASKLLTYVEDRLELTLTVGNENDATNEPTPPKQEKARATNRHGGGIPLRETNAEEITKEADLAGRREIKKKIIDEEIIPKEVRRPNKIFSPQGEKKFPEKPKFPPPRKYNVKEKGNLFLLKVLSPPNFPTFQRKKES